MNSKAWDKILSCALFLQKKQNKSSIFAVQFIN